MSNRSDDWRDLGADLRLLAAAPELLKVLRDLTDAVEKYTYGSLGDAEDAARELIARIDGEEARKDEC